MPTAPAPITYAPPILWAAARALITTIFALFGEPARIAAQHTHRQSERRLLLKWLRAGEALMRHLLLIEAAAYARPNTRPLLPRAPRKRARRLMTFEPDKPEAWRVSFRCLASAALRQAQGSRDANTNRGLSLSKGGKRKRLSREERGCSEYWPKPKFYNAWPLAERAEALLRAFNTPEPYARRLAARLHATPHRARELTQHPPNLPHVIDDYPALREEAHAARRRFESG